MIDPSMFAIGQIGRFDSADVAVWPTVAFVVRHVLFWKFFVGGWWRVW